MRLTIAFFRIYPGQISIMLVALLLASLAEGISMSALLPFINIASGSAAAGGDPALNMNNDFSQRVVEFLGSYGVPVTVGYMLAIILAGLMFKNLLLLFAQRQVGYIAARIATDLRLKLLRAILKTRWEYFLHQPSGKLTNALATEASRSSEAFVNAVTVITFFLQALIYGGIAFALAWKASLISLVFGGIIITITHGLVRMARKAGKRQTRVMRSLLSRLTDTLQSVKPLKAMSREHLVSNVLAAETSDLNRALERQVLSSALLNAGQDMMFALVIVGGIYVAIEIYNMPLTTILVLVVALGQMLASIGKVQKQYQKQMARESAFWSIQHLIDEAVAAEEKRYGGVTPRLNHGIRFEQVSFSYDKHKSVLKNVDLEFPVGQLTLVVGPSGAGKTTIMDMTIGLLAPDAGRILVDDTPLTDLDIHSWRSLIGYVPQETLLLHDSIRNNVTLGDPDLSDAQILQALEDADLAEVVAALPEGIDTVVGERGSKLSGGQRQRVMIARALVNQPQLLVLDEATSALDSQSEAALRQTLEHLRGNLTILAIAHGDWLSTTADRVYRLEAGNVRQLETHAAV